MRVKVLGIKWYRGTIEGKALKSGKVYTECKLDGSRNVSSNVPDGSDGQFAAGVFTEEWKVDPALVQRLMHVPLPFLAELETERVGNGKESRELVIDLRPIEAVKAVKAA